MIGLTPKDAEKLEGLALGLHPVEGQTRAETMANFLHMRTGKWLWICRTWAERILHKEKEK